MDSKKQVLINSVISFLQDELNGSSLNEDKKESIEVAVQCLETAFELDSQNRDNLNKEKVDLLSLINVKSQVEVTEEHKSQAEEHKTKGNNLMRNTEYAAAVEEYTKAIQLNPNNAVYYCNRAAAYTRLVKDYEAIEDCNEAIRLDPAYGKAYGRLGISYSNLNKYDLAQKAYQKALEYDPNNTTYEANLKVAQERLYSNTEGAAPLENRQMPDISQFLNNPNIINMASQVLSDPNFCNMMSGIMNMGSGDAVETMMQAGQTLAQRIATEDPSFYDRIRRNLPAGAPGAENPDASDADASEHPSENNDKKTE